MRNNRISLCTIVKDEAEFLDKMLSSCDNAFFERIIVDTGSSDNTIYIAKNHGCSVHSLPWNDDFSQARNYSLSLAIGEWVVWADADDEFPKNSLRKLQFLSEQPMDRAFAFMVKNTHDGALGASFQQIRMFPNKKGIRFCYPVHEQLGPSLGEKEIPVIATDFVVYHTGYTGADTVRDKCIRNLKIIMGDPRFDAGEPVALYTAACTMRTLGRSDSAREGFWSTLVQAKKSGNTEIAMSCLLMLADIEKSAGHLQNAMRFVRGILEYDSENIQGNYITGEYYFLKDDYDKAEPYLDSVINYSGYPGMVPVDINFLKLNAALHLSRVYLRQRNMDKLLAAQRIVEHIKDGKL